MTTASDLLHFRQGSEAVYHTNLDGVEIRRACIHAIANGDRDLPSHVNLMFAA